MTFDSNTLLFWLLACLASWIQTLTGFALGLLLMGGVGIMGLMPLPEAAIVTSVLVVVNGTLVLRHGWRDIDLPALKLFTAGTAPALLVGYALLTHLAGNAISLLQLLLGIVIALASIQLAIRPAAQDHRSPPLSFVAFGAAGGLMGGLFATTGPPIIFHIYRQPLSAAAIRNTLVAVFGFNQLLRLGVVVTTSGIAHSTLLAAAGAIPAVAFGSYAARRWPPPLSPVRLRYLAVALLFLSGMALILPVLGRLMT